ncbi:hypothetical protein NLU13_6954 [Sarocladium strictum]|uniref:Gylcosyl hydrolase 115 C-terminal domain-containing protein n=1 Tax=Sarocladium strictum TaxID=5046 RepID=A0AA39GED3_SARSR|nr:hypothetical protein NLU13_6954 [Sarocladium strictum]
MRHLVVVLAALAVGHAQLLFTSPGDSGFKLADQDGVPDIWVSKNDIVGVERAAQDVAWDFGRVIGENSTVVVAGHCRKINGSEPVIIAGTIGNSSLIDGLIADDKLDVKGVKGEWESFTIQVVEKPTPAVPWALVIAGSDRRGTIYGLYDLSEQMGVSPWYWWADVPVKTKSSIWVSSEGKVGRTPSVKYRGFFINDEAPALSSWVKENFGGTFNSKFYALVFELCLRLKGNYIWPAMWGKMFYVDDEKNGQLAHDYGVIMGTSHHEPMARSEREQQLYAEGDWDWSSNKENLEVFFQEGIDRARDWDTIFTMGMRGKGDVASPTLTAEDLEELIGVQQGLLMDTFNTTDPNEIAQTWVLYKEVSEYYATGLEVPDSVTLLWTDDNSGNLIRVPTANESDRTAGAGVYYHFDYVGAPRSYKWINTIQLVKTWEQMHLAYTKNARRIWIANVGDIKPLEIPLAHFMDMAYDMDRHQTPESTTEWIKRWVSAEFDSDIADETTQILNDYGTLVGRRKYELLSELPFAFSTTNYDEAERNLAQWEDLLERTQAVHDTLDEAARVSYFQLILHPILAGKTVVDLYTQTAINKLYAQQGRVSTNYVAQKAHDLFAEDADITDRYHRLNGGKWNHFVNQVHIGYTSWDDPPNNTNIMPALEYSKSPGDGGSLGVAIQGSTVAYPEQAQLTLRSVDPYMPDEDTRHFDVFLRSNTSLSYKISSNTSYVSVSKSKGVLTGPGSDTDARSVISVDWEQAPDGLSFTELRVTSEGSAAVLILPVNKTSVPSSFRGFVESNGVVAIEAASFTAAESGHGVSYVEIPHYGRTISGVKPWPASMDTLEPGTGPALVYNVYTTTTTSKPRLIVSLGSSHNHDPTRLIRYAYSIDGSAPKTVAPVSREPPYKEGPAWRKAVVENGWTSVEALAEGIDSGEHEIKIWLLEPGVVLQKLALDMGGYKTSALGPPQSKKV